MQEKDIQRYLENWKDERNTATIYLALAEQEQDERLAEVYKRMAESELRHAKRWEEQMQQAGATVPQFQPALRTRILLRLAKSFGPNVVLPNMQAIERGGARDYLTQSEAKGMSAEENSHARLLNQMTRTTQGGLEGGMLAQMEGRHRATGGNALRAAVLGANDGLVSNLSLVMGVAGAALENRTILITGLAGMLAGAISMALGEWLSVQSSRELFAHQIAIEAEEIEQAPEEETEELALIYEARGLPKEQARSLAEQIIANHENAVETLAREELGMDPKELGGSAWEAAITSFVLFAIGAIIPVIGFAVLNGMTAIYVSILSSIVGLFVLGAVTSLFTGRSPIFSGGRMVLFGLLAAALTFGIGRLVGVGLGG